MEEKIEEFKKYKDRIKQLEDQLLSEKREKAGIKSALGRANKKIEESNLLLYYALVGNNEVKKCKEVEILNELRKNLME